MSWWCADKFGAVNSFIASRLGSLVFVPAMTIAPGAWQPKFDEMDSIEKMQEVRSDVGVQWLLLTRTMEASRKVVEIIRWVRPKHKTLSRSRNACGAQRLLTRSAPLNNRAQELRSLSVGAQEAGGAGRTSVARDGPDGAAGIGGDGEGGRVQQEL